MTRDDASRLDTIDPLADYRDQFVVSEPDLIYLDGNSLGRLPRTTMEAMRATVEDEWGRGLVRSWHEWIDLPERVGDQIAPLIGARPGEVLVADQTSVNLFKLASAALASTGRGDILTDETNFPSDLYILDAVARAAGGDLRIVTAEASDGIQPDALADRLDAEVGLVSLSHVAFKSGALADMPAISSLTDAAGALTLWDLSHSVGAVPVDLNTAGAALAVGCTYKYLNGGPGAPAFLYVRRELQDRLCHPIRGWFGHADMFDFSQEYTPAPGVRRFATGTPPIVSLRGVEHGVAVTRSAGMTPIRAKSISLTTLLIERFDARLVDLGCSLGTPREVHRRGSHVAIRHADAYRLTHALIDHGVVPDFRAPETIRFGVTPLSTTHVEVFDAIERLAEILETGAHLDYPRARTGVT